MHIPCTSSPATSPNRLLRLTAAVCLVMVSAVWIIGDCIARQSGRLLPVRYFGAHRPLQGKSPYGSEATAELGRSWHALLLQPGSPTRPRSWR